MIDRTHLRAVLKEYVEAQAAVVGIGLGYYPKECPENAVLARDHQAQSAYDQAFTPEVLAELIGPESKVTSPHSCSGRLPKGGHGEAIEECTETDGTFWVSNDEYASQVAFCPYCGTKAPIQPEVK